MKGKEVLKYEQHQPSNSKMPLNINHTKNDSICGLRMQKYEFSTPSMTFSCTVCQKQFPSKRSLGGHKKAHKSDPQNNNKGNEVVQSEQYQPSSSKMPRGHQMCHKREREIHRQENNNNCKKVLTMKGNEVVKSEQHQPSNSVILVPIIDLTNNGSICGWKKVQEHDIFTPSKTFSCKNCNRSFSSARALGGHVKIHKRKLNPIKLEDSVGESSINVDTKSNSILHKSTVVALPLDVRSTAATCGDYHDTIKEEAFELDLSLKL
ncbi:zinc finger protein 4-like [Trifolium medium]|uniref:Zinc finger protein 4-like n=1 Tax=Trifolium medium TaxID=97028 RepID=A0A392M112_9FABA|nr:zinc finger protein 4-like [Trifolium medium]